MNKDVIAFIPAKFGSFIGLVFMFGVLGIIIHIAQLYQTWCWQVVMDLTEKKRSDRTIKEPLLENLRSYGDFFLGLLIRRTRRNVEQRGTP